MIIGSPAAFRMDATRPSSGSFQPLISISTTSGRIRSSRSMKLVISPRSRCSTITRNGSRATGRPAPAPSSSRFSIASPMVRGYMLRLRLPRSLAGASRSRPQPRAAQRPDSRPASAQPARRNHRMHRGRRPGRLPLLSRISSSTGMRVQRRLHRHRPGLVQAGRATSESRCSIRHERLRDTSAREPAVPPGSAAPLPA